MVPSTRFCDNCGAANRSQGKFCISCGAPLYSISYPQQASAGGYSNTSLTGLLTPNQSLAQRYRIIKRLGQGGMAAVYKAEDIRFGNASRAVKEMSQSGLNTQELNEAITAFEQEAILLSGLMHPNLPRIYDHFGENGRWYLVMDYIEGETLKEHVDRASGRKLSIKESINIALQLCTVFSYLHTHQPPIIFRDLKPSNVMITSDGHVYLIDFGIARRFKMGQAKDTVAMGTIGYVAPEATKAQTTASADIYSLGATLHEMLTGDDPSDNPFQFAPLRLGNQTGAIELERLITQMVALQKDKRPQSMLVIKQELQRIAALQAQPNIRLSATMPSPSLKTKQQWIEEGNRYHKARSYNDAIKAYSEAISLDNQDARTYFLRGNVYKDLKRYEEFSNDYAQAIRIDPNFADAYVMLAKGLYEQMEIAFEEVDETQMTEDDAKGAIAGVLIIIEALNNAIAVDPKNVVAYCQRGLVYGQMRRFKEALDDYNKALSLDPKNSDAYLKRGLLYIEMKQTQRGLNDMDQAIALDAQNAELYTLRGQVYAELGKPQQALNDLNRAIALDSKNADAYAARARVNVQNASFEQALEDCGRYIALSPNDAKGYFFRGIVYGEKGQHLQAIKDLDQAIALDSNNSLAYWARGKVYFNIQQYREALEDAERALALDPNDKDALSLRKEADRKLNKKGWFS